jgi:hypothetical protein
MLFFNISTLRKNKLVLLLFSILSFLGDPCFAIASDFHLFFSQKKVGTAKVILLDEKFDSGRSVVLPVEINGESCTVMEGTSFYCLDVQDNSVGVHSGRADNFEIFVSDETGTEFEIKVGLNAK